VKVCDNCGKVILDKTEACPECGCVKFTELLTASYDNWESYLEEKDA